jgi:hypothetical protein
MKNLWNGLWLTEILKIVPAVHLLGRFYYHNGMAITARPPPLGKAAFQPAAGYLLQVVRVGFSCQGQILPLRWSLALRISPGS